MSRWPGLFITGSDTDVGKTYVATRIVQALVKQGASPGVYKPAASGCSLRENELVSDDALALWQSAGYPGALEEVCPQKFIAPLAPHLAAEAEGRVIDTDLLRTGCDVWRQRGEPVIVEGAGGYLSPIAPQLLVADLAVELGYPLVIVVANKIGAINQALLTCQAASQYRGGLPITAVVLNDTFAAIDLNDPSRNSNFAELARWCQSPLFHLSWQGDVFLPHADWLKLVTSGVNSP